MPGILPFAAMLALSAAAPAEEDLDIRIERAIDKGVAYLRGQMEQDPWDKRQLDRYVMGRPAIEVYALVKSDVSVYDPVVQAALQHLAGLKPSLTYCAAIYLMALDAGLGQIEFDLALARGDPDRQIRATGPLAEAFLRRMNELNAWLLSARRKDGAVWDYRFSTTRFDNSNTQFAILALGVAAKRGLKVPAAVWEAIAAHFVSTQQPDGPAVEPGVSFVRPKDERRGRTAVAGKNFREERPPAVKARGWGYQDSKNPTLTMTAAGLSSLIIAREHLFKSDRFPVASRQRINQSIWDATAWLAASGLKYGGWLYYALYSIEKVGDLGMMEKIGGIDWYRQGVDAILKNQQPDGSWAQTDSHDHNRRYQTAFALLFLNRATDLMAHSRPMILSGRGSGAGRDREGYVYVERLKGEIALNRLFRKLKYSPQPGAVRLCEDVVRDATNVGRPHELIPYLIDLVSSPYKPIGDLARRSLQEITGEQHENPDGYRAWSETWSFVAKAGREKNRAALPKLLDLFRTTASRALKMQIIWTFERLQAREAFGDILDAMGSDDAALRARAYGAIKFLTGGRLVFDPEGPAARRADQIAAWRQLVAGQGT